MNHHKVTLTNLKVTFYEPSQSDINKFESYLLGYEPSQSDINKFESYLLGYEPSQSDINKFDLPSRKWTITKWH